MYELSIIIARYVNPVPEGAQNEPAGEEELEEDESEEFEDSDEEERDL
jgi:hypothetical protein